MDGCRFHDRMRPERWREIHRQVPGKAREYRAMQKVVRVFGRVSEHHVSQYRVVQPLQHAVRQSQEKYQGRFYEAGYKRSLNKHARSVSFGGVTIWLLCMGSRSYS